MCGEDDGATGGAELLDQIPELAPRLRIKARRGFVEEEQFGVADQCAGEGEALLLAARESADAGAALFIQLYEGDHLIDFAAVAKERAKEANRLLDRDLFGELCFL